MRPEGLRHYASAREEGQPEDLGLGLEAVRKGSCFPEQRLPSGSGWAPSEGAVAFSSWPWGWIGSRILIHPFGGNPFSADQGSCRKLSQGALHFPNEPILCTLCDLCGSPPHPARGTCRGGPMAFSDGLGLGHGLVEFGPGGQEKCSLEGDRVLTGMSEFEFQPNRGR